MLTVNESMLKPISVGYVAVNKLRSSVEVEVILAEINPFVSGEIVDGIETLWVDGIGPDGSAQSFTVKMSNTIRATWMGDSTNRISAPDVRRGDKVQILQYGNVDKYYWQTVTEPGINIRKKETIIEAISNTIDEKQTELNATNSWFKEFSTHDKKISIVTNKSDGEKWAFTLQLDVGNGNLVVADDTGMFIQMNSEDETIELGTTSGGLVKLVKKVLTMELDDWKVTSKKATFDIGDTTWNGSVTYNTGSYTYNGKATFKSGVFDNNKSIGIDHQHSNVQNGNSNSGSVA